MAMILLASFKENIYCFTDADEQNLEFSVDSEHLLYFSYIKHPSLTAVSLLLIVSIAVTQECQVIVKNYFKQSGILDSLLDIKWLILA
jgi:hypothetical protein